MILPIEFSRDAFGPIHPERMKITQPRVGATAPTLGCLRVGPTLKGLDQGQWDDGVNLIQPFQGCAFPRLVPRVGARDVVPRTNPGLNDCNPVGEICKSRSSARKSREGLLKVARRFIAGYRSKSETRPGGTVEIYLWKCPSSVPTGRSSLPHHNPAMNGRATFNHSYGMIGSQTFAEVSVGVAGLPCLVSTGPHLAP